jgi:hypothetical protein
MLNIALPNNWFLTLYPNPDIRINFGDPITGQTGRLFLPVDFMVGRTLTRDITLSLASQHSRNQGLSGLRFQNGHEAEHKVLIATRARPATHVANGRNAPLPVRVIQRHGSKSAPLPLFPLKAEMR